VYQDLDLATYVEFDEAGVLLTRKTEGPLGGSTVWVKAEAIVPEAEASTTAATFLAGQLTERFLGEASASPDVDVIPMTTWACVRVTLQWCTIVLTPPCNITRGCSVKCPSGACPSVVGCRPPPGYSKRMC
jgi:hypothetical protein